MKRTFTKYPSSYVKASYSNTEPLSPEERERRAVMFQQMNGLELLEYYRKYLTMCEGSAITAPTHELGETLDLVEAEILKRLG